MMYMPTAPSPRAMNPATACGSAVTLGIAAITNTPATSTCKHHNATCPPRRRPPDLAVAELTAALKAVSAGRRGPIRSLVEAGGGSRFPLIAVLRAVAGARSTPTARDPLRTMPGHLAQGGRLTSSEGVR